MNRPVDQSIVDLRDAPAKLARANRIALIGNGGNMAIAQHMASDIFRHTGKFAFAPDSVNTTALADQDDWKVPWIQYGKNADLVIGITCRLNRGITNALMTIKDEVDTILIAPVEHPDLYTIVVPSKTYHQFEVNALWTIYMMMEEMGVKLPELPHVCTTV